MPVSPACHDSAALKSTHPTSGYVSLFRTNFCPETLTKPVETGGGVTIGPVVVVVLVGETVVVVGEFAPGMH